MTKREELYSFAEGRSGAVFRTHCSGALHYLIGKVLKLYYCTTVAVDPVILLLTSHTTTLGTSRGASSLDSGIRGQCRLTSRNIPKLITFRVLSY
jgi:hypothetical protein